MAVTRGLKKCVKFVASLFRSRKSKEVVIRWITTTAAAESSPSEEAIRSITTTAAVACPPSEEAFAFKIDQPANQPECQPKYPVFGRDISKYNDCDHQEQSDGESSVDEFTLWEPDLTTTASSRQESHEETEKNHRSNEPDLPKSNQVEHFSRKPMPPSWESRHSPPKEIRPIAWVIAAKLYDPIEIKPVCSLEQEMSTSRRHVLNGGIRKLSRGSR